MGHNPGESLRFKATFYDLGDSPADASDSYVSIFNPKDEKVIDEQSPTSESDTGKYHFDWDIPTDAEEGIWTVEWKAIVSSFTTIDRLDFPVSEEEL